MPFALLPSMRFSQQVGVVLAFAALWALYILSFGVGKLELLHV